MAPPVDRSIHRPLSVRVRPTTVRVQCPTSGRRPAAGETMSSDGFNGRPQQSHLGPRIAKQTLHLADDCEHAVVRCQKQGSE